MKPTILCVDDQPDNLKVRTMLLEVFGCKTVAAVDRHSALLALNTHHVDLMLIDYHLGFGETGEDLARAVGAGRPDLPLIMLTGDNMLPATAVDAVDRVLIKGASDAKTLMSMIQELLPDATIGSRRLGSPADIQRKAS